MSEAKRQNRKWLSPSRLLVVLGVLLVLTGFVLAHLSNANVIYWSNASQKAAHVVFHIIGPILILFGIIIGLIKKFRSHAS